MLEDKKAIELRREYLRRWRQKNKAKVKQYNEEYWKKKAEKGDEHEKEIQS